MKTNLERDIEIGLRRDPYAVLAAMRTLKLMGSFSGPVVGPPRKAERCFCCGQVVAKAPPRR